MMSTLPHPRPATARLLAGGTFSLVLLAALVVGPRPIWAQEPAASDGSVSEAGEPQQPAAPTEDELHDGLRSLKTAMETALNTRDLDGLLAHVTDDVIFTTMNGDVVRGPEGIREYFAKMMEGEQRIVDNIVASFVPEALSILVEDDVAISYGSTADRYELRNGDAFEVEARWSATMVRRPDSATEPGGGWKVASFHYSTNMFDNPILDAQRKLLVGLAVGAGLLLLIVGFFVGRRVRAQAA